MQPWETSLIVQVQQLLLIHQLAVKSNASSWRSLPVRTEQKCTSWTKDPMEKFDKAGHFMVDMSVCEWTPLKKYIMVSKNWSFTIVKLMRCASNQFWQ